ncbi:unnamed protein product [Peniophora sp. CBMAI 1063]|nr:unnamed protein product [Peniophora sp. CBMAI 1063]
MSTNFSSYNFSSSPTQGQHSNQHKYSSDLLFDASTDVQVPSLQDFELDLDSLDSLGALPEDNPSLQQLFNSNPDPYGPIRNVQGTPSVFSDYDAQTVSSVTASSFYSAQPFHLPQQTLGYNPLATQAYPPTPSYNQFVDPLMEFQNVRLGSDYGHPHPALAYAQQQHHPQMPWNNRIVPSPPRSPHHHHHAVQRARSEYQPAMPRHIPRIQSSSSSYSPEHHPTRLPTVPHVPAILSVEDGGDMGHLDSRRKHQCPNCPRAFARAFNLKTHMETHNPNRAKPYVCPHRSCARSFSRKHDLQRHRAAIHHDQSSASSVSPPAPPSSLPETAAVKAEPAPQPRLTSHSPAGSVSSLTGAQGRSGTKGYCNGCGNTWYGDKICECKS